MTARTGRLTAAVAALLVLTACSLWPNEERRIERRLRELASSASADGSEAPLARVAAAARLGRYFTEDAVVEAGERMPPVRGRDALMAIASQARGGGFRIAIADVQVTLQPPDAARAYLTVSATRRAGDTSTVDARELQVDLRKVDGEWLLSHVTAVDTLRRPE